MGGSSSESESGGVGGSEVVVGFPKSPIRDIPVKLKKILNE